MQLIDAETANHLWAERFDKPVADLFDMQDEIVSRLANQLNAQLIAAEARRAETAPHPDSMDLYFRGMAWANKGASPENYRRAHDLFEHALTLDPANINALVGTAKVDSETAAAALTDDPASYLATAETAAIKALALAPNHAWAHFWLGMIYTRSNRSALAIAAFDRALALDRNLAFGHAATGLAKAALGRADDTWRVMSGRRCAFRRATAAPMCGNSMSARRNYRSPPTWRPNFGCGDPSNLTAIFP
jgi:tetratricopeptide (TPR) repeat protein